MRKHLATEKKEQLKMEEYQSETEFLCKNHLNLKEKTKKKHQFEFKMKIPRVIRVLSEFRSPLW